MIPHTVFACYACEDNKPVNEAASQLLGQGAAVFKQCGVADGHKSSIALRGASRVVLFWSQAASKSWQVEQEWRKALDLEKPIVVVRLDETPLEAELSTYKSLHYSKSAADRQLAGQNPSRVNPLLVIAVVAVIIVALATLVPSVEPGTGVDAVSGSSPQLLPLAIVTSLLLGLFGGWLLRKWKCLDKQARRFHPKGIAEQILSS